MSFSMRKLIATTTVAAASLAFGAASANAGVTVNDNTPTNGQALTATVSAPPAGATQYTLAECNVTSATPADWGRDCNATTALGFSSLATTTRSITVNSTFTNTSFVPGQSPLQGMTSTCSISAGSSRCGVVVSWYNASFASLGASTVRIFF